jgi:hypothetical protein
VGLSIYYRSPLLSDELPHIIIRDRGAGNARFHEANPDVGLRRILKRLGFGELYFYTIINLVHRRYSRFFVQVAMLKEACD